MPRLRLLSPLGLFLLLLGGYACSFSSWQRISIDELRRMLPRYSLMVASLEQDNASDSLRQASYTAFLADYGYTLTDWDSSLSWYARHDIVLFHDLYRTASDSIEKLYTRLQARQDSLQAVQNFKLERLSGKVDGFNVLDLPLVSYQTGELINRHFSFQPLLPYDSMTRLELSTQLFGLSASLDSTNALELKLRIHLSDSTSRDSTILLRHSGRHRVELGIPAGKTSKRISGYLRGRAPRLLVVDSLRLVKLSGSFAEQSSERVDDSPIQETFEEF